MVEIHRRVGRGEMVRGRTLLQVARLGAEPIDGCLRRRGRIHRAQLWEHGTVREKEGGEGDNGCIHVRSLRCYGTYTGTPPR